MRYTQARKDRVHSIIQDMMEDNGVKSFEEIDSLSMMDVIMNIEDAFDISIPLGVTENLSGEEEFVERVCGIL